VNKSSRQAVSDIRNLFVLILAYFLSFLGIGLVNASFGPAVPVLWLLLGLCLVCGLMGGAINVGGNILLIWASPKRLGSSLTVLHIFYGAGAFLSPILIAQAIR
jgi:MFS family permease